MSNEDYITGDDMTALLISQGGSEAATYALSDDSPEASRARLIELIEDGEITPHAVRDTTVPVALLMRADVRNLIAGGYVYDRGRSADYVYMTDLGAALAAHILAANGCRCSDRTHLIMAAHAAGN